MWCRPPSPFSVSLFLRDSTDAPWRATSKPARILRSGRLVATIARRVEGLDEIPVGPAGWAGGVLSIVAVRHLLEIRSSLYPLYPPSAFYVHYVLAYLAPLLALSLVLSVFSTVRLE